MVSEGEIWKLEKDLCRCCHAEGNFDNLANEQEIYSDMLRYCFDIDVTPVPGALCAITYTICPDCILKLRDASAFKKQVQLCEEKFLKLYSKKAIIVNVPEELDEDDEEVKDEPEVYFDMDFPEELSPDEEMVTEGAQKRSQRYKIHDYEDEMYSKDESEDEEEEPVIKKVPAATKKKAPQKSKPQKKQKEKEEEKEKQKQKTEEKQIEGNLLFYITLVKARGID
ncbi:unnamed protein product [Colias eurytheme]|nr:unnamed protein product [Colias eurytheme]